MAKDASGYSPALRIYFGGRHYGKCQKLSLYQTLDSVFDLKGRKDMPMSYSNNVTMRNIDFKCDVFFNVSRSDQYQLKDFTFENLNIRAKDGKCDKEIISNFKWDKVKVNN